jgi:hypothetical protein
MMTAHNSTEVKAALHGFQSSQRALLLLMCLDVVRDAKKNKIISNLTETETLKMDSCGFKKDKDELYSYLGYAISNLCHYLATERHRNHDHPLFNEVFELVTKLSDVGNTEIPKNYDLNPEQENKILQSARADEPVVFTFKNQGGLTCSITKIHSYGYLILEIIQDHFKRKIVDADTIKNALKSVLESEELHQLWTDVVDYSCPGTSEKASNYSETYIIKKVLHSRCATYIYKTCQKSSLINIKLGQNKQYIQI